MIKISDEYEAYKVLNFDNLSQNFIELLLHNLNDKDFMQFSRHRMNRHTFASSLDFFKGLQAVGGHYYQIHHIPTGHIVGTFTLRPQGLDQCEAGILVFKEFTRSGIALQVWQFLPSLLRKHGFRFLVAGTHIQNTAMRRIMEKVNMELDSTSNFPVDKNANPKNIYFRLEV